MTNEACGLARKMQVLADWERPRHEIHVMYPATRHLSARLRVFVDWTAEAFEGYAAPPARA